MSWKELIQRFSRDDRGQATTEYILMLLIAISIFVLVYMNFLKPFVTRYEQTLQDTLNNWMFPVDFHSFPIHR